MSCWEFYFSILDFLVFFEGGDLKCEEESGVAVISSYIFFEKKNIADPTFVSTGIAGTTLEESDEEDDE